MFQNYKEALDYIYSFTDFERDGRFSREPNENLPRTRRLLALLGNPQERYSITHVAGTKGKGSTSAYIERVLRTAGVRTGLYTQPDLHTFRERIQISGELIREDAVVEILSAMQPAVMQVQQESDQYGDLITYDIATALMFLAFARQGVEHAVIEVGLGGRLDATNVVQPFVSVITSISYDHMHILGNTLGAIAREKAGIIKTDTTIVTSARHAEPLLSIAEVAQMRHAPLIRVGKQGLDLAQDAVTEGKLPTPGYQYRIEKQNQQGQVFSVETPDGRYTNLEISLLGEHQIENATLALAALEAVRKQGISWQEHDLRQGLRSTHWPARLQVVGKDPVIIIDGAHNGDSMHQLRQSLTTFFPSQKVWMVFGVVNSKDLEGIIKELDGCQGIILGKMQNLRALDVETLAGIVQSMLPATPIYPMGSTEQAIEKALELAAREDIICVAGSLYFAAEALRWAARHGAKGAAADISSVDH